MSKYTTEIRFLCEVESGLDHSVGYNSLDEVLDVATPKIFNFDFPMFDESYRSVLERKILKHYYTREISEESVGLWKLRLNTKLNEIMPYYNKLYNSELLEFNPLYTVNLTRDKKTDFDSDKQGNENITDKTDTTSTTDTTSNRDYSQSKENENDGTYSETTSNTDSLSRTTGSTSSATNHTESEGDETSTNYELFSDTPQGALTGVDNETYLTNAKKSTHTGHTEGTADGTSSETVSGTESVTDNASGTRSGTTHDEGTESVSGNDDVVGNSSTIGSVEYKRNKGDSEAITSTEDYLEHVVGYEGTTGSKMLKEFRETFLNIDMMVINELEVLFFQLW